MDFYDREENAGKGCAIVLGIVVMLMASVTLLMACNWLNSF